jgi:MoxR-like ATPase
MSTQAAVIGDVKLAALRRNLETVILGKPGPIFILTIALAAGGSVLMEDVPGVGKTTLAKALAKSIDGGFSRVQFTPDLLPADILGSSIYNPITGTFSFRQGPIFCNVLLADEINRASPRTQSALLEAMNESQVTIEGKCYPLPVPFLVLATQNPVDFHGTYPLPEAQLDRFLVQLDLGYPSSDVEQEVLYAQAQAHPLESLPAVITRQEVLEIQHKVRQLKVEASVAAYIVEIVGKTRSDGQIKLGASPRASIMLFRSAQACAYCQGRNFVLPDDVQTLAPYVLAHRVMLTEKARYGGITKRQVIDDIVAHVKVPT